MKLFTIFIFLIASCVWVSAKDIDILLDAFRRREIKNIWIYASNKPTEKIKFIQNDVSSRDLLKISAEFKNIIFTRKKIYILPVYLKVLFVFQFVSGDKIGFLSSPKFPVGQFDLVEIDDNISDMKLLEDNNIHPLKLARRDNVDNDMAVLLGNWAKLEFIIELQNKFPPLTELSSGITEWE